MATLKKILYGVKIMTYIENVNTFENEIRDRIGDPGHVQTDGRIHRFDTDRRKDKAGWYIAFVDGDFVTGAYGSWKGEKYKFCSGNGSRSEVDQAIYKQRMAEAKQARLDASEKAKRHAAWIWKNATDAAADHPYLLKKGVKAHGAKQYKGALLVPVMVAGEITSMQFIGKDGLKRFIGGGTVAGGSWTITGDEQQILTEGYATAASIHEATGATVKIAFNAGNLLKVAEPGLTIAGDNDAWTTDRLGEPWNPGREKALAAAWEHNCKVVIPTFHDTGTKPTDFNDLQALENLDPVRDQIGGAVLPHEFLLNELESDPGAAYRKEHVQGLKTLKERNKAAYMALRPKLIKLKTGITELEKDFYKIKNDGSGAATDHLSLAREIIDQYGKENLIFSQGFIWKWNDSGVWKIADPREIKIAINAKVENALPDATKSAVESILDFFKTEIFRPNHIWDTDTTAINCQNGEVLWTGDNWKLEEHCREHYRTSQIPVAYDITATAPDTEKYLIEIFKDDPDRKAKIRLVCELLGYSLLTTTKYEKFVILIGIGANGKSVLIELLISLVGPENAAAVQPSKFDSAFQRAYLLSKLVNAVSELAVGEEIRDDKMKSITSGEQITCEKKFQDPFDMNPYCTIWLASNHMPRTRDFSPALFRRALIITFNRVFAEHQQDKNLKDKLKAELPGVLNLALACMAGVFRRGYFTEPESCKFAKKEWRLSADQSAEFIRDECRMGSGFSIPSKELYAAYLNWAENAGIKRTLAKNSFTTRVCNLGATQDRTSELRILNGIDVKVG